MSGAADDLDRQRRAALNQDLFRQINERIEDLAPRFAGPDEELGYVCECLDSSCVELISIPHDAYERVRRNPTEFIVIPGHEDLAIEEIVDQTPRWLVVRKVGAGGSIAENLAEN